MGAPDHMEAQPRFPSRIINVRGTNGGGKTTIMKNFLRMFGSKELADKKGRTVGYEVHFEPRFFIVGDYKGLLGGCDVFSSVEKIVTTVEEFSQQGDVLFEGILVSLLTQPWIKLVESLPKSEFIFATLNTPLKVCLKRREKRWRKEGHKGSFDPAHMTEKFYAIREAHKRLESAGMDTRWLDYRYTTQTVINWLLEGRFAKKEE